MKLKLYFENYVYFSIVIISLLNFPNTKLYAQQTLTSVNGWNAYVHLPWDYSSNPSKTYPTIIFFPGTGEVGTDASLVIANGPGAYITQGWNGNVKAGSDSIKFIVISLQPPARWPQESAMNSCIQTLKGMYRIDNARLHLTGLSMGGWCSNTFVTGDATGGPYTYASQVATVVEVEGVKPDDNSPYPDLFDNFAKNNGRLLGFEQVNDSRDIQTRVDRMNSVKANSGIFVSTNFGGGGHCCWEQFYGGKGVEPNNFILDGVSQNLYQWMAVNPSPSGQVTNQTPVSDAGNNISITLPENSVTLNGSGSDADGTISGFTWSQTSGPSTGTIVSPNKAGTDVNNLIQGTYKFTLTVTDNNGATAKDSMQVTVAAGAANQAPVSNAGPDITITLPTNSATLSGSATDADGTIASYEWIQLSGPNVSGIGSPTRPQTTMNKVIEGTYVFQLKVTDDKGATAVNNMQLIVKPESREIVTGKSIMVNIYGGSNPYNNTAWNNWNVADGTNSSITSSDFKYSDGTTSAINSILSYSQGVGDNDADYQGGMAPAEVLRYTSYSQPARTLTIAGLSTSVKYDIELYASRWSSGNSTIFTINGTSITISTFRNFTNKAVFTNLTPDAQGKILVNIESAATYNHLNGFMITQQGSEAARPENVTQQNSMFSGMVASAGNDITIKLPVNAAKLKGSGLNTQRKVVAYEWTKLSGPSQGKIMLPNASATTITGLTQGVYQFALAIKNNKGNTVYDTVQVTVNANKLPVAYAGNDTTIILPAKNFVLNGSGIDADGKIISYTWKKIAGKRLSIVKRKSGKALVSLSKGTYKFELTVTDDSRSNSKDTVAITVNAPPNRLVANAGTDITIMLPAKKFKLSGSGTSSNAKIVSYKWRKIFGNNLRIVKTNSPNTKLARLSKGIYLLELTITDKNGTQAKDTMQLTVQSKTQETLTEDESKAITNKVPENNNKNDSRPQNINKNPLLNNFDFDIDHLRLYNNQLTFNITSNKQQQVILKVSDVKGSSFLTTKVSLQRGVNTVSKFIPGINRGIFYINLFTDKRSIVKAAFNAE